MRKILLDNLDGMFGAIPLQILCIFPLIQKPGQSLKSGNRVKSFHRL